MRSARGRDPVLVRILRGAVTGTLFAVLLVSADVNRTGRNVLNLLQAGSSGPSAPVIIRDFPRVVLPAGLGYDGQQYYAIARQPMHWSALVPVLDRPQYRLQRPLFPWLAWVLHPQGGGQGLIFAFFAVGAASLVLGGLALGLTAVRAGRPSTWAAAFGVLPGALVALRTTTADGLAVALVLCAVAAERSRRTVLAVVCAVGAVLAKEVVLAVLVGNAIATRSRAAVVSAAAALCVFGTFWAVLGWSIGSHSAGFVDLTWPLFGLMGALRRWATGQDLIAAGAFALCAVITIAALRRTGLFGRRCWLVLVSLSYVLVLRADPIELNLGGPRTLLPVTATGLLVLLESKAGPPAQLPAADTDDALRR